MMLYPPPIPAAFPPERDERVFFLSLLLVFLVVFENNVIQRQGETSEVSCKQRRFLCRGLSFFFRQHEHQQEDQEETSSEI